MKPIPIEVLATILTAIMVAPGCSNVSSRLQSTSSMSTASSSSRFPSMTLRRVWAGSEVPQAVGDVWSKVGVSPDGAFLLYDDGGLVRRDIATNQTRRLATHEGAVSPRVSPDGRQVAYVTRGRNELRLVSSTGEAGDATSRVLYEAGELLDFMIHDWAPDGRHILAGGATSDEGSSWRLPGAVQMLLISVTDGAASVLKTLQTTEGWAAMAEHSACFSSDGRYVFYDDVAAGSSETDIYFVATDGSREGRLVEQPGNDFVLGCVPGSDQLLFASERTGAVSTWTMRVTDGRPQPPELVKDQLGPIVPIGVTRTGAYFYGIATGRTAVHLGTFDASTGTVLAQSPVSLRSPDFEATPSWSPDGRYLAYTSFTGRGYTEARKVVILAVETGVERVLHPALTWFRTTNNLQWSPDGRSLLTIALNSQGIVSLYRIDVQSGAVSGPLLPRDANVSFPFRWSKDGNAIYYIDSQGTRGSDIRVHDLGAGRSDILYRPVASGDAFLRFLDLSPDGAWLAVGGGRSDSLTLERNAVLIIPTGGGRPRQVFRAESGQALNLLGWTPDGTLLFNSMGALWRVAADGGQAQRLGPATAIPGLRFHPDGRRVAYSATAERSVEVWVMENFLSEARARR